MSNQCAQVLRHLKKQPLTPLQALRQYGIARLAARVYDLRSQGYAIDAEMIDVRTKAGKAKVARYSLEA